MSSFEISIPAPVLTIEVLRDTGSEPGNLSTPGENEDEVLTSAPEESIILTSEELEAEIQNAFQKGFAEGELKGYQKCEQEIRPLQQQLNEALSVVMELPDKLKNELEIFATELSISIAHKLVGTILEKFPGTIIDRIRQTMDRLLDQTEITVYTNPSLVKLLQENIHELRKENPALKEIRIVPDHTISAGGFIVETGSGILDNRIESVLEEIRKYLRKEIRSDEH